MRRRELMLLLGGAMTAARSLRAQQKGMPVIGYLNGTTPEANAPMLAAFRQGLSETGWVEARTVAIEYRWAEFHYDRLPALAADLVGHKVNVTRHAAAPMRLSSRKMRPRQFRLSSRPAATRLRPG